jgi:hypothetical protein
MKKIINLLFLAFFCVALLASCTKEEVKPSLGRENSIECLS